MKKVLVISFYWPPFGGGGVQRWLKMTKYLPEFGWKPIVYTPESPHIGLEDDSLEAQIHRDVEVIKQPIWEPYDLYKKFSGRKKDEKVYSGFISEKNSSVTQKLSVWIRGNLFIPDARKFWIKPSIKYLLDYLKENPVDAIVSTGPPHSMHLIAEAVHKKTNIPWIADFRDPWTNIDFYKELQLTSWADRKHRKLEKRVIQGADEVICVTPTMTEEFKIIGGREIHTITNGFDPEDFSGDIELDNQFTIAHIGSINKDRNPIVLWEAFKKLCDENEHFSTKARIKLVGPVDAIVLNEIKKFGLEDKILLKGSLPHKEAIVEMRKSGALLLIINQSPNVNGIMPGKMYEYFGSGRPVICIGPEVGDARGLIEEYPKGTNIGFEDVEKMKSTLLNLFENNTNGSGDSSLNDKYNRRTIAKVFSEMLNKVSA